MTCGGSRAGILASNGNRFTNIRKMTVRRYAAVADNHVDFYELTIRDNSGSRQNPNSGQIYPSQWIGTFSNLFDGNHYTRWHTNSYTPGGYVDEFTTMRLFNACGVIKKRYGYNTNGIHPSHLAMGKGTLQTISCGMPTPKCM